MRGVWWFTGLLLAWLLLSFAANRAVLAAPPGWWPVLSGLAAAAYGAAFLLMAGRDVPRAVSAAAGFALAQALAAALLGGGPGADPASAPWIFALALSGLPVPVLLLLPGLLAGALLGGLLLLAHRTARDAAPGWARLHLGYGLLSQVGATGLPLLFFMGTLPSDATAAGWRTVAALATGWKLVCAAVHAALAFRRLRAEGPLPGPRRALAAVGGAAVLAALAVALS